MGRQFSAHTFRSLEDAKFEPYQYSLLKFGSDEIARKYGHELASAFFKEHSDVLMSNRCVVIPSPYNYVENAATIMAKHFVDKVNQLLVDAHGEHVEFSNIHRKVTYTNDYGFLTKEKRKGLIGNDKFYFNRQFIEGKLLIFIDDVRITGTHEEKILEVMEEEGIKNDAFFLYYGNYSGGLPDTEAKLNFAGISCPDDYLKLVSDSECHVIVRTIKYVLGLPSGQADYLIGKLPDKIINRIYNGCLGEGYYKVPSYQRNFEEIRRRVSR